MTRVTAEEVAAIIDTSTLGDTTSFLTSAEVIVANIPSGAYTEPTLKQLELYVSAHLIAVSNPHLGAESEQKDDSVTTRLLATPGTALASTVYGQQATALDFLGHLSGNNKDGVATTNRGFLWVAL